MRIKIKLINITNCKHKICVGKYMEIINEDNDIEKIAKEQENIRKYIEGKDTKKIIYVDKKLLNFVI